MKLWQKETWVIYEEHEQKRYQSRGETCSCAGLAWFDLARQLSAALKGVSLTDNELVLSGDI